MARQFLCGCALALFLLGLLARLMGCSFALFFQSRRMCSCRFSRGELFGLALLFALALCFFLSQPLALSLRFRFALSL